MEMYKPIEDYGIIGNLHTVALVSKTDASIDYCCFPDFDSPSLFGRLLSAGRGGHFSICAQSKKYTSKQFYLPSSNVLVTRFYSESGVGQVTDLMPVTKARGPTKSTSSEWPWLIRKLETIRGSTDFKVECKPAFDYARKSHNIELVDGSKAMFKSEDSFMAIDLRVVGIGIDSQLSWKVIGCDFAEESLGRKSQPMLSTTIRICENQGLILVLRQIPFDYYSKPQSSGSIEIFKGSFVEDPQIDESFLACLMHETNNYWHEWISQCTYRGRWREIVHRSALVLKLLTYAPTGAIVASPTTSLPEDSWLAKLDGGKTDDCNTGKTARNWDYRFTWIRDAAFTIYAFLRIGFQEEARAFMRWIEDRCHDLKQYGEQRLRILYDIRGGHPAIISADGLKKTQYDEIILSHWEGYRGRGPVRIGNAAAQQIQMDIYGELMDSIYLCDKYVEPISWDFWCTIREAIVGPVLEHWGDPDHGIWEIRGEPQHYVHSRLMSWVALDRAVRLAIKRSLPCDLVRWREVRDAIREEIMIKGWDSESSCFIQAYASQDLDASNLMMPLVLFLSPNDPRFVRTLEATLRKPEEAGLTVNNLVFRFTQPKDVSICPEGTFTMCSFWLVEAMARAGQHEPKYLGQAQVIFEDILGYANHVGLFSEEVDLSGRFLGNFPQAFTHLSLISAAFNLDRRLDSA